MLRAHLFFAAVALRKESVDRNYKGANMARSQWVSLSARRAWIEMTKIS